MTAAEEAAVAGAHAAGPSALAAAAAAASPFSAAAVGPAAANNSLPLHQVDGSTDAPPRPAPPPASRPVPLAGAAATAVANGHTPPHMMKSSQYRGVSWCKRRMLWEAAISINGKRERLGFYRQEEEAASAYDHVATWRNLQLAREQAQRGGQKRRRGGGGGDGIDGASAAAGGVEVKRHMSTPLPLNMPLEAPETWELDGQTMADVLADVREAAKERLKDEEGLAASVPTGQRHKRRRSEAASPQARAPAATLAAAAGIDLGAAAAAAALQAAGKGAGAAAAGEAAGAAAAAALHPVPIPKSSRFQGVCLCANKRWQAQVTYKRKRHYLGMHGSEEAAARAYDQGAICLLGATAETNYPIQEYDVAALHAQDISVVAARLKAAGSRAAAAAAAEAAAAASQHGGAPPRQRRPLGRRRRGSGSVQTAAAEALQAQQAQQKAAVSDEEKTEEEERVAGEAAEEEEEPTL
ncbi:hypothetical protein ABPG77_006919 [Micractinium sp. CCAP 211/92]